jgi:3-oxoacyl-[acyl-carrier protein] reductase
MYVTYSALPYLKAAGGGSIVYVSTDAGRFPTVGESFPCGAAAALHMMTRTISLELKRYRIRVNAVATTVMAGSPGMLVDLGDAEKVFAKVLQKQTFGLEPIDVAQSCAFLSSGLAGSITGQILSVNGGVSTGL